MNLQVFLLILLLGAIAGLFMVIAGATWTGVAFLAAPAIIFIVLGFGWRT